MGYFCLACVTALYTIYAISQRYFSAEKVWPPPFNRGKGRTLVFRTEDLRNVWEWEVAGGHYPSSRESERPYIFAGGRV